MSKEEREFDRGYNFGKRDAYKELVESGQYKKSFADDTVTLVIPHEVFINLQQEAERTA